MATNKEILDDGRPLPTSPPVLTDAATRYGNALSGVWGSEGSTTDYGSYLMRIPSVKVGQAVVVNVHTTAPGLVQHIQAVAGGTTGPVAGIVTGVPATGQVLIEPQSGGEMKLTFAAADAVTQCAYCLLAVPADLISHLEAASTPT